MEATAVYPIAAETQKGCNKKCVFGLARVINITQGVPPYGSHHARLAGVRFPYSLPRDRHPKQTLRSKDPT